MQYTCLIQLSYHHTLIARFDVSDDIPNLGNNLQKSQHAEGELVIWHLQHNPTLRYVKVTERASLNTYVSMSYVCIMQAQEARQNAFPYPVLAQEKTDEARVFLNLIQHLGDGRLVLDTSPDVGLFDVRYS